MPVRGSPGGHDTSHVPELLTPRLRLRGHAPSDLDAYAAMWADPEVVRHITGRAASREESWARLLRHIGHWSLGFGFWILEDRADGTLLGEAGLADFQREMSPPPPADMPECGWLLVTRAHGRGLATEAVQAVVAWGERSIGAGRAWCMMSAENAASARVAEKCGFRFSHAAERGTTVHVLTRGSTGT